MLLQLDSERAYEAIGALTMAGFRVVATKHPNRYRIIDAPHVVTPPTLNDVFKPKRQK